MAARKLTPKQRARISLVRARDLEEREGRRLSQQSVYDAQEKISVRFVRQYSFGPYGFSPATGVPGTIGVGQQIELPEELALACIADGFAVAT